MHPPDTVLPREDRQRRVLIITVQGIGQETITSTTNLAAFVFEDFYWTLHSSPSY
jgi:hypothetical protein